MSRYSHTVLAEQAEALAALPDLRGQTQSDSETAAQSAVAESVLGRRLGSNEQFSETSVDSSGLNLDQLDRAQLLAVLEDVLDLAGLTQQPPNGLEPLTCGLQNRTQDDVNQCYFRFYDDPQKRLGAALAHLGTTDPDLVKLLNSWPHLPTRLRTALAAYAFMASRHSQG